MNGIKKDLKNYKSSRLIFSNTRNVQRSDIYFSKNQFIVVQLLE